MASRQFVLDIDRIRGEARDNVANGSVTPSYDADQAELIEVLNQVVATEIVCYLRYTQHSIAAKGIARAQVAAEFTEHAAAELGHALRAAVALDAPAHQG